jgi:VNT family MFS transporter (synaptic vesicle glycoprotein 2)
VVIENKEHFSAWHQVLLVCSLPSLAAIIGFVFLPESPRYLLEAGREVEAMMVYQVTVSNAVTGHDSVPSTSHPHNLL